MARVGPESAGGGKERRAPRAVAPREGARHGRVDDRQGGGLVGRELAGKSHMRREPRRSDTLGPLALTVKLSCTNRCSLNETIGFI